MTSARLLAAALIACAFEPAVASAAAQPPFPHHYRGTISGTWVERDTLDTNVVSTIMASWTITGLALRRGRVMKSDAAWQASYSVTSGEVAYHEAETGACSYTFDKTLPLRTSINGGGLSLSQSLFFNHPTTAMGGMDIKHAYRVSETCQPADGGPAQVEQRDVPLPELFDPQEKRVKLGRRFAGHTSLHETHQASSLTTKWRWVLKPGH